MPQPLSKVAPKAQISIGNPAGTKPALMMMAMEALATWSYIDYLMLRIYVELSGGYSSDATAAFLALETAGAKSGVIRTLANRNLQKEYLPAFNAVLAVLKSGEKERHKLAHWVWATSPSVSDGAILFDPRNITGDPKKMLVYRMQDFVRIRQRFDQISGYCGRLTFIVIPHPANTETHEKLCAEPEIADKLNRQAQPKLFPPQEWPEWLQVEK